MCAWCNPVDRERTRSPDRRASIALPPIQQFFVSQVTCNLKNRVELSPTREKLKEANGFIICDGLVGLINLFR